MKRMIVGAITGSAVILVSLVLSGCLGTPPAGAGAGSGELAALPAYGRIVPAEAARVLSALRDDPNFVLLDIRTPAAKSPPATSPARRTSTSTTRSSSSNSTRSIETRCT